MILLGDLFLVVMDRGGIYGAYFDQSRADLMARSIEGVVAKVPIVADHRVGKIATQEAQ